MILQQSCVSRFHHIFVKTEHIAFLNQRTCRQRYFGSSRSHDILLLNSAASWQSGLLQLLQADRPDEESQLMQQTDDESAPLLVAAQNGHFDVVELLTTVA